MNHRILWLALASSWLTACTTTASLTESELSQTAQQGHGKAQYELARRLAAKPDYPEAMRWMKQAAQQSGPLAADSDTRGEAALQVGRWYQSGLGEPKSPTLANDWWQRAAKLGNREASYQLGMDCQLHHKGKLVSECLDWFEQAAKQDHAQAQLILGQWYAKQSGADTEAIKWLEKAAEQGNRDAQYQLGLRYEQGKGVNKRSDLPSAGLRRLPPSSNRMPCWCLLVRQVRQRHLLPISVLLTRVRRQPSCGWDWPIRPAIW